VAYRLTVDSDTEEHDHWGYRHHGYNGSDRHHGYDGNDRYHGYDRSYRCDWG